MCITHLFHPEKPCCGDTAMCKAFPSIDWTKATWKVKQPAALWSEVRYAPWGYPGSPLIAIFDSNGDAGNGTWYFASYVGSIPQYQGEPTKTDGIVENVYTNTYGYHMRAGEFVSRYRGQCQWEVYSRERLAPAVYGIMALQNPDTYWLVAWQHILESIHEWTNFRVAINGDVDPITGPFIFTSDGAYTQNQDYINWRHLMQAAECQFIPLQISRGYEVTGGGSIEGGLIPRLNIARARLANPVGTSSFYRPTALDLAVEWTLSGGLRFGIESNPNSPFYGQFVVFTGAVVEIIETGTIEIHSTDRTFQNYPTVLTVQIFRQWGNDYLLKETFLSEFDGEEFETPFAFAARIAATLRAAWPYDGPPVPGNSLSVSVVQNGTSVSITTRTIDASKGGYPLGLSIDLPELNEVLGLMSVSVDSRETLVSQPSPWQLVNRPAVVAEFGVVNRFERTDDNDTLPAWIELELIPL